MTSLSVVVVLTSGGKDVLRRCLTALHAQTCAVSTEILVPYDVASADVATLQPEFPEVRFLPAGDSNRWDVRAGASREHDDTLRTIGIRAATGEVIALTEDHAYVTTTWCDAVVRMLEQYPGAAALAGAIDCESTDALSWAVWFCDFGRYQSPLPEGRLEFASDTNVAYRRHALEHVADAWRTDYHEPLVHRAMLAAGFELRAAPRMLAWQARSFSSLGSALRERYVWGRVFAGTRAQMNGGSRWGFAVLTPLLPFVLTWRLARITMARRRHTRRFLSCLPRIVLLQGAWALGELVGYVTADPRGSRD